MSETLRRPPSLRTFLDAGCDITTFPGWENLVDSVLVYGVMPEDAEGLKETAEMWLRGEDDPGLEDREGEPITQDSVTHFLWEAECSDEVVARALSEAVPDEVRSACADKRRKMDGFRKEYREYLDHKQREIDDLSRLVWGDDSPVEWPEGEA
ncbi:MAG TPA: hypothetical protein VF711_04965 [Acidimicrobiales bacterium]